MKNIGISSKNASYRSNSSFFPCC